MPTDIFAGVHSTQDWARLRTQIAEDALAPGGNQQEIFQRYYNLLRQPKWKDSPLEPIDFERIIENPILLNSTVTALEHDSAALRDGQIFVINGEPDHGNQHPEVVAVQAYMFAAGQAGTIRTKTIGSGVRISSDIFLTAAHVVRKYVDHLDRLGVFGGVQAGEGESSPREIVVHPEYDHILKTNDLAVVRMPDGVSSNVSVLPILQTSTLPANTHWRAVGYGKDPEAQANQIGIRRFTPGSLQVELCTAEASLSHSCHIGRQIIARRHGAEFDTCYGDSGGPLLAKIGDVWRIAGISARRLGSNQCGPGSLFTWIGHYLSWISEAIAELGGEMPPQLA